MEKGVYGCGHGKLEDLHRRVRVPLGPDTAMKIDISILIIWPEPTSNKGPTRGEDGPDAAQTRPNRAKG